MCGLVSSKQRHKEQGEKLVKILQAHQAFCREYQMQSIDETIEYQPKSGKWTVHVKPPNEIAVYRLELMIHDRKNCRRISEKKLNGDHLMMYSAIYKIDDVVCFLYYSLGNIRNLVKSYKLVSGRDKEVFLQHILVDFMAAVVELDQIGRYHTQLSWENVEIIEDPLSSQKYRGRLSALEFVRRKRNITPKDLAPIEHRPPEILSGKCTIEYSKALTYIIGSMMLELLVNKYMSGVHFQTPKANLTASTALEHIKQNSKQLVMQLASSTLSEKMQRILIQFLEYDCNKRCTLSDVLGSMKSQFGYQSTTSFRTTHPGVTLTKQSSTDGKKVDIDELSVKSDVGPIDVETNQQGVFIDGVHVVNNSEKHGQTIDGAELATVGAATSHSNTGNISTVKSSNNENVLPVGELSSASNGGIFIDLKSDGNAESQTLAEAAPTSTDNEQEITSIKIPEEEVASLTSVVRGRRKSSSRKKPRNRYSVTRKGRKNAKKYD
ncbi:hypothetical protein CHUAL_009363 [Chamberlinius hualienensis]